MDVQPDFRDLFALLNEHKVEFLIAGGYWDASGRLQLNHWTPNKKSTPIRTNTFQPVYGGEDEGVLFPRMERDGWVRAGDNWGKDREIQGINSYQVECVGDDGYTFQPSPKHPVLRAKYVGYFEKGRTFRFSLDEFPELLDDQVEWATWDYIRNLIYAKQGNVYLFDVNDLEW